MEATPATIPIRPARRILDPQKIRKVIRRMSHRLDLARHWWLRPHTPYQALFIIASARSGSTLLVDYVRRLPSVQSEWEVLNWTLPPGPRRRASARQALQHIRATLQTMDSPIRSCKLFLDHLEHFRLSLDDLNAAFPGSKFIVLYRQSLAEQFASLELARATSQWRLAPGQEQQQVPVTIEPTRLRKYCDRMRRAYHEAIARPWLRERAVLLSYEELTADPGLWIGERIAPLLGVAAIEPDTWIKKQNTRPLSERIANYPEVAALLASSLCQQRHVWPGQWQSVRRAA